MNENVFNTQSSRDARILARRKRIQERLATMREGDVLGALLRPVSQLNLRMDDAHS